MKTRLQKSIEYIASYCDKHTCEKCKIKTDENEWCFLRNNPPCDWIELIQRKAKENK